MRYFLLFSILFINFLQANQNKDVLLIHSYHKGYAWTDDISKAIEKNFSEYKDIELTTVYIKPEDSTTIAAELIINKITEQAYIKGRHLVSGSLIIRDSVKKLSF